MRSKSNLLFRRERECSEADHKIVSNSCKRWRPRFVGQRNRPTVDPVLEVANAAA